MTDTDIIDNNTRVNERLTDAEQEHLDLIAGIGYRKALEFFVKDFSILTNPDDEEKITKMSLKQVIEDYIEDKELKTCALASAYIGNDEGHYYRKNPDKNLTDLKNYIHGVIYYLEMKLNFLDAQELVNRSKKSQNLTHPLSQQYTSRSSISR